VTAHAEITHVVEENHARRARSVDWFEQQCANEHIAPTRLAHNGRSKIVVLRFENREPFRHASATEIRRAVDDKSRRFAAGVRVDHVNPSHLKFMVTKRTKVKIIARFMAISKLI
jgi:hypothetical protein